MRIRKVRGGPYATVEIDSVVRLVNVEGIDLADEEAIKKRFEEINKPLPLAAQPGEMRGVTVFQPDATPDVLARRAKLREIADAITGARDRGFAETDKYAPSKGLELARQLDLVLLYVTGKKKAEDLIWARNWWTGHQEQITVGTMIEAIEQGFEFRQKLREHEQDMRQEVEAVMADTTKSAEERAAQIEAIVVEPYLGLSEQDDMKAVTDKLRERREKRSK